MTAVALYVLLSIRGFRAPAPLVAGTVGCGPSSTPSQSSRSERCPQGVIAVGDDTVAPGMLPAGARPGSNIRVNGRKRPNIPRARAAGSGVRTEEGPSPSGGYVPAAGTTDAPRSPQERPAEAPVRHPWVQASPGAQWERRALPPASASQDSEAG